MSEKNEVSATLAGDWSKPASQFIEEVSSALGGAFKPYQIKRVARAEAEARIESVRADIAIKNMNSASEVEAEELRERTLKRMVAREVNRQINIENTLAIAAKKLSDTSKSISQSKIPEAFIQDFFSFAENVSDEQLQELWAGLLYGKAIGTHSSKLTMQTLQSMDRVDAELFEKFASCCGVRGSQAFCFSGADCQNVLIEKGVKYEDLKHLERLGLISDSGLQPVVFNFEADLDGSLRINFGADVLSINYRVGENNLPIGKFLLTRPGKDLLTVVKPKKILSLRTAILEDLRRADFEANFE